MLVHCHSECAHTFRLHAAEKNLSIYARNCMEVKRLEFFTSKHEVLAQERMTWSNDVLELPGVGLSFGPKLSVKQVQELIGFKNDEHSKYHRFEIEANEVKLAPAFEQMINKQVRSGLLLLSGHCCVLPGRSDALQTFASLRAQSATCQPHRVRTW